MAKVMKMCKNILQLCESAEAMTENHPKCFTLLQPCVLTASPIVKPHSLFKKI